MTRPGTPKIPGDHRGTSKCSEGHPRDTIKGPSLHPRPSPRARARAKAMLTSQNGTFFSDFRTFLSILGRFWDIFRGLGTFSRTFGTSSHYLGTLRTDLGTQCQVFVWDAVEILLWDTRFLLLARCR